jgi:hypothetical protein
MDLHGYYVFVDVQADSISDPVEYIGRECPIQPDRQNQRERIHRGMELHGFYIFISSDHLGLSYSFKLSFKLAFVNIAHTL